MKRFCRQLIGLTLSLFLAVNSTGIYASQYQSNTTDGWQDVLFEDITYFEIDEEEIDAILAQMNIAIQNKDTETIDTINSRLDELATQIYSNYQLAQIYVWKNYFDEDAQDLLQYYSNLRYTLIQRRESMQEQPNESVIIQNRYEHEISTLITEYTDVFIKEYMVEEDGKTHTESDYISMKMDRADSLSEMMYLWYGYASPERINAVAPLFISIINKQNEMARALGYKNYTDFYFDNYLYYSKDQMYHYAQGVREHLLPLYVELLNYADQSIVSQTQVIYEGEALLSIAEKSLYRISDKFIDPISFMKRNQMYDISHNPNKLAYFLGCVLTAEQLNLLYLITIPNNSAEDFTTLIHELGHYVDFYYKPDCDLVEYREIISTALELMIMPELDGVVRPDEEKKIISDTILAGLKLSVDSSCSFLLANAIYEDESLTVEKLDRYSYEYYHEIMRLTRDDEKMSFWANSDSLLNSGYYQNSYSLAYAASYQLFQEYLNDKEKAVEKYIGLIKSTYSDYNDFFASAGYQNPLKQINLAEISRFISDYYYKNATADGLKPTEGEEHAPNGDRSTSGPLILIVTILGIVGLAIIGVLVVKKITYKNRDEKENELE